MYYIMEIQTQSDGTSAHLISTEQDIAHAESKFHTILSAAAVSTLTKHSALIIDDAGNLVKNDGYNRENEDSEEE